MNPDGIVQIVILIISVFSSIMFWLIAGRLVLYDNFVEPLIDTLWFYASLFLCASCLPVILILSFGEDAGILESFGDLIPDSIFRMVVHNVLTIAFGIGLYLLAIYVYYKF